MSTTFVDPAAYRQQKFEEETKQGLGTGVRPASAIRQDPPADPLVAPFLALAPGEGAILYGSGGSTKGTTAAYLALRYVREELGKTVLILDFEHHEAEWGGRLRRLGATEDELGRIHYASPYGSEWTATRGLLPDVAHHVRADCERLDIDLLIVDSITTASASGEAMGGQAAATEYFDALAFIGRRSLSLAHVAGNASRWPDRPFGSVHLHNLARETWAIAVTRSAEEPDEKGLTWTEVELRCKKANGRRRPAAQVLTYTYEPDYGAISVRVEDKKTSHGDLIHAVLTKAGDELRASEIVTAIAEDTGEQLTKEQVYEAIRWDRKARFVTNTAKRPASYSIREGKR